MPDRGRPYLEACVGVRPALRPRVHPQACRAGRPHLRRRASATERRARFHLDWRMHGKTLKREYLSERAGRRLGDARFGGARCLGLTSDPAGSLSRKGFTLTRFSRAYRERFVCIRIHKLAYGLSSAAGSSADSSVGAAVLPFRVRCDRGIVGDPLVAAAANPGTEREVGACGGDRAVSKSVSKSERRARIAKTGIREIRLFQRVSQWSVPGSNR